MAQPCFCGETLDDVMREVVQEIQANGDLIVPTKGECRELTGVLLEVRNPRARLSRTETRGKPFSCLGELCWYLAKSNELDFVEYYIPLYRKDADGDVIVGGYGPRLFDWKGVSQFDNVVGLLRKRPFSRQAVIQLFDARDLADGHKSPPCTCTLQFVIRSGQLHLVASMRSNDVFLGLPHDVFAFTMIQEIMARTLDVELGVYRHVVGSLHLYEKNREEAQCFMDEGWQSTETPMPPMPVGDPWKAIQALLEAESVIRVGGVFSAECLLDLNPYWLDLIRLLQVFRFSKTNNTAEIQKILGQMSSKVYHPFIRKRLSEVSTPRQ